MQFQKLCSAVNIFNTVTSNTPKAEGKYVIFLRLSKKTIEVIREVDKVLKMFNATGSIQADFPLC